MTSSPFSPANSCIQSQYAAYLLYIASLCLSKLSLSTFIRNLTPVNKDHFQAAVLQVLITVVGVIGVIGTAFQCHMPRPWDYWHGQCFNLVATLSVLDSDTSLSD